jgi:hypothetical protein
VQTLAVNDIGLLRRGWELSLRARNRSPQTIRGYLRPSTTFGASWPLLGCPQRFRGSEDQSGTCRDVRGKSALVPKTPVPVVTASDLKKLLATASGTSFENRRDTVVIRLSLNSGLQLAELTHLAVWTSISISLYRGAGQRPVASVRALYRSAQALDRYLRVRSKHRVPASHLDGGVVGLALAAEPAWRGHCRTSRICPAQRVFVVLGPPLEVADPLGSDLWYLFASPAPATIRTSLFVWAPPPKVTVDEAGLSLARCQPTPPHRRPPARITATGGLGIAVRQIQPRVSRSFSFDGYSSFLRSWPP